MDKLKKTIAIIVAAALLLGLLAFSINYRNKKNEQHHQSVQNVTTASGESSDISESGEPVVVTDDGEYEIYYDGTIVTIVKGDYSIEVENWSQSFDQELPTAVSKDVDGDGEKELLLKVFASVVTNDDGTSTSLYSVFLYKPYTNEKGEKTFTRAVANSSTWIAPFEQTVRAEVTQLESCNKILQYTMANLDEEIEYDKNGLSTGEYVGYARALADNNGKYYSFSDWELGQGIYSLDSDGNISLKIQVIVKYDDIDKSQIIGFINCQIQYGEGGFSIVPKKIYFTAQDIYRVSDPRDNTDTKWSSTVENTGGNPNFQNKSIDWIDWEFDASALGNSAYYDFSSFSSKIKCVDTVELTQFSITLTAKDGYQFSSGVANSGDFSVMITDDEDKEVDIAYTCSAETVGSKSTLVITLDRNYAKSELAEMVLKFGA